MFVESNDVFRSTTRGANFTRPFCANFDSNVGKFLFESNVFASPPVFRGIRESSSRENAINF